tara:strand:+ start:334 stop:1293 length:960 start_codon:yes stop_codon:yes gene_type:complete
MILLNSTRTALFHVLKSNYHEFKNKKLLVPSFTCHTVTDVIIKANINFDYYELLENFEIDFYKIDEKLKTDNFFAIIGTNYFGFPYYINEFLNISNKYGVLYFEDNSHGLGSTFNNCSLGTFGDYGFTSLTKHIRTQSGGILNIKSKLKYNKFVNENKLKRENIKYSKLIAYYLKKLLPKISNKLINLKSKKLIFDNPFFYKDNYFSYSKIDKFSEIIFKKYNITYLREKKLTNYKFWEKEINKNFRIKPLFKIEENINPWCVPYLISDSKNKNDMIKFVQDNHGTCFTWPSLPNRIINENKDALKIWKHLLCISTMNK